MSSIPRLNYTICPNSCYQSSSAQTAATTSAPQITTAKVSEWLTQYMNGFARFEKMTDNGLSSLVKPELQAFTELHNEGIRFTSTPIINPGLNHLVRTLVAPRMEQLGRVLVKAQTRCADKEAIATDKQVQKKWTQLGLPASVLENHADCAHFLVESGLVFSIVGYKETCGNSDMHDLKLGHDGHPMIKVQGEFKRWDRVKQELVYDETTYQIRSRAYPGSLVQNWTYLHPNGLVPIDRMNHEQMVPIYQITQEERQRVMTQAQLFYQTNPEVDQGIAKDWVVQFHTSPIRRVTGMKKELPDHPGFDNLARNVPTHIVMRLVAPNGDVYSFGLEQPAETQEFLFQGKPFAVGIAKINKAGDYEEFRHHKGRIITSIPLTTQRAENIIRMVNTTGDVRFNFLRQACANLANIVMNAAGYPSVEMQTPGKSVLYEALPDVKHLPYIGCIADKVKQLFSAVWRGICWMTPTPIQWVFSVGTDIVLYTPKKLATIFVNVVILKWLGGADKMMCPLPQGVQEDELYKADRFLNFSRLIRSWTDCFKEETAMVYHSKYFLDWQRQQASTFIEPYTGRPKLTVAPPQAV